MKYENLEINEWLKLCVVPNFDYLNSIDYSIGKYVNELFTDRNDLNDYINSNNVSKTLKINTSNIGDSFSLDLNSNYTISNYLNEATDSNYYYGYAVKFKLFYDKLMREVKLNEFLTDDSSRIL